MQVKKAYMHTAIVEAAEEEFAAKGFQKASLRKIAEKAGTRISNIYNYFKNKEALYQYLVEDFFEQAQLIFLKISTDTKPLNPDETSPAKAVNPYVEALAPLMDKRALLLITASEGTRFSGFRNDLEKNLLLAVGKMCGWYPIQPNPKEYPINLFISLLVEDLIKITKMFAGKEEVKQIALNRLRAELISIASLTAADSAFTK